MTLTNGMHYNLYKYYHILRYNKSHPKILLLLCIMSQYKKSGLIRSVENSSLYCYLRDPIHKNSVFLIANTIIYALVGFLFWTIAARLYSVEAIGQATAIISAGGLLVLFSSLGMSPGVVRFLAQEKHKTLLVNSALTIVAGTAFLLSILFLSGLKFWAPALRFVTESWLLTATFILFCIFNALYNLQNSIFIAFRAAHYVFYQCIIASVKIIFLLVMIGLSVAGIVSAVVLGAITAVLMANIFIRRIHVNYRLIPTFDTAILKNIFSFSFGNYIGDVFRLMVVFLMPLLVISVLGAEQNAYFNIAWLIAGLLFSISYAVNFSLLAETSFNSGQLRMQVLKAAKFIFIIIVPAIILLYFLGGYLLSIFGESYAQEGLGLLRILTISSIPVAVNEIGITILRIHKNIKPVIVISLLNTLITVTAGYKLLGIMGLSGIGIAWLCSSIVTMVIMLLFNIKYLYPFLPGKSVK